MHADAQLRAMFADILPLRGLIEAGLDNGKAVRPTGADYAALEIGDFVILGGNPQEQGAAAFLEELIMLSPVSTVLVYAPGPWGRLLADTGVPCTVSTRWSFDHDVQPDDRRLQAITEERHDVRFVPIDGALYRWCREQAWTYDFVSQFPTEAAYRRSGMGVLVEADGRFVAGASSYVSYRQGIEIQVETRKDCEGRGYATLAAAELILMAHQRGWRATWDAASEASAHIARKLGYLCTGAYEIIEINQKG
ncbi:MAG: GNAT family N-acetyltransferase [Clostridia bacterium]|nr:GNAT family N-acetyltransferase [Clostridia bacterium]